MDNVVENELGSKFSAREYKGTVDLLIPFLSNIGESLLTSLLTFFLINIRLGITLDTN